ncbi:MAG: hypothetical protein LUD84_01165 [Clostridiales bacterium]|nr:hypothetical protein [Clostridiales bacterium]
MALTPAQKRATEKYLKSKDEIRIRLPKGQKGIIKDHALQRGESVNAFIARAIENQIKQDSKKEA